MKITLLQQDIAWADPAENQRRSEAAILAAPLSDLYVLPEMWSTGFNAVDEDTTSLSWMKQMAARMNAVEDAVEKIELRNPLWRDDFTNFYRTYMANAEYNGQESDKTSRELFRAQAEVIRRIAAEESCVIIGRCGFDIFADTPNTLKIFIHSSVDCRKRRIAEKYDISEQDAAAMIVDNDFSRELYTKTYTGRDWTNACNYDISLDVRKFGVNGAVDFLMKCIE